MKNKVLLLLTAFLCFSFNRSHAFVNGDFQTSGSNVFGWTNSGVQEYNSCQPTSTNWWIDLTGTGWGNGNSISQTISTVPGKWYVLQFDLGTFDGHNFCDAGTDVEVNGTTTHYTHSDFYSGAGTTTNYMKWKTFQHCFQATSTSTLVKFTGNATTSWKTDPLAYFAVGVIGLDNVSYFARSVDILSSEPCYSGSDIVLSIDDWATVLEWAGDPNQVEWYQDNTFLGRGATWTITGPGTYIVVIPTDCGEIRDTIVIESCCDACKPDISWSNICFKRPAVFTIERGEFCESYMSDAYTIKYGDGTTENLYFSSNSFNHTYPTAGVYTVEVCWTENCNQTEKCTTFNVIINCECPCDAEPDFDYTTNCLQVQFTNKSTGNILCQHWDFGDGNTSSATDPSHTYSQPGTYHVCLTVFVMTSEGCCCQTYCEDVTVRDCPPEDPCDGVNLELNYDMHLNSPDNHTVSSGDLYFNATWNPSGIAVTNEVWTINGVIQPGATGTFNLAPGTYVICVTYTFTYQGKQCTKKICKTVVIPETVPAIGLTPRQERKEDFGDQLNVKPNPATQMTVIGNIPAETEYIEYKLINTKGEAGRITHISKPGREVSVSLEALPAGVYMLEVSGPGIMKHFKVIKQ